MPTNAFVAFLQRFRRSALLRESDEKTDGQLLECFVKGRDSVALEALVQRHAPMVWGVCRRALTKHHEAEDAFQATFLVLLRKAPSIQSRDLLANWLYRVAHTTARKARQMAARRRTREMQVEEMPEPQTEPHEDEFGPEIRALLDEELSRLPEKYRVAILLCDLEGKSRPEAALQLRLPEGTVGSRLARGRALLAQRLARRCPTVSATSLAAVLARHAAGGTVQEALLTNTIKAFRFLAAGETVAAGMISPSVSQLTEGVLHTMTAAKRNAAILILFIATIVLAGGMVTYHSLAGRQPDPEPPIQVGASRSPSQDAKVEVPVEPDPAIFGTKEGAIAHVRNSINVRLHLAELWGPRTFDATLDREKHQWTLTGVFRLDLMENNSSNEKEMTFVVHYDTSSQRYDTVMSDFDQSIGWGKPIGPQTGWHPTKDFGKWIKGNFPKPTSSANPVSSIRLVSSEKVDWLGQRESYSYDGHALEVIQRSRRSVTVRLVYDGDKHWSFRFGTSFGRDLEVGGYGGTGFPHNDEVPWPYGVINPVNKPRENEFFGKFVHEFFVWEMDLKDPKVPRLAIDFLCVNNVCGSLRVNSHFKPAMPVPKRWNDTK
jgi:RNA polymerase sigma factor (sigma-70 family)